MAIARERLLVSKKKRFRLQVIGLVALIGRCRWGVQFFGVLPRVIYCGLTLFWDYDSGQNLVYRLILDNFLVDSMRVKLIS